MSIPPKIYGGNGASDYMIKTAGDMNQQTGSNGVLQYNMAAGANKLLGKATARGTGTKVVSGFDTMEGGDPTLGQMAVPVTLLLASQYANKLFTRKVGGKRKQKGGIGMTEVAVPAVLLLASNMMGKGRSTRKLRGGGLDEAEVVDPLAAAKAAAEAAKRKFDDEPNNMGLASSAFDTANTYANAAKAAAEAANVVANAAKDNIELAAEAVKAAEAANMESLRANVAAAELSVVLIQMKLNSTDTSDEEKDAAQAELAAAIAALTNAQKALADASQQTSELIQAGGSAPILVPAGLLLGNTLAPKLLGHRSSRKLHHKKSFRKGRRGSK